MKKWALLGTIIAFSAALSMLIAPTSIAMPTLIDTSKTIDPFGENVGIVFSSDSHKVGHPEPGKKAGTPGGGGGGAPPSDPPGQEQDRVDVCHKGKTKSVPPDKVADHLGHGDTLGKCP